MSTKKHASNKELNKLANQLINSGKSKKDVFNELSEQYYESDTIAKIIGSIANQETKKKFKAINNTLFFLLILSAILKVASVMPLLTDTISGGIIVMLLVPLINIFFAIQVKKMRGEIYLALGLLAAAGIFKSLQSVFEVGAIALIDTLIITGICIITFYIKAKAFPNFGFSGIKKGKDGHYQF
tara:strand:- start:74 stop:625 length:552 start_codon:yes stop_codon:yes gene_type:complete